MNAQSLRGTSLVELMAATLMAAVLLNGAFYVVFLMKGRFETMTHLAELLTKKIDVARLIWAEAAQVRKTRLTFDGVFWEILPPAVARAKLGAVGGALSVTSAESPRTVLHPGSTGRHFTLGPGEKLYVGDRVLVTTTQEDFEAQVVAIDNSKRWIELDEFPSDAKEARLLYPLRTRYYFLAETSIRGERGESITSLYYQPAFKRKEALVRGIEAIRWQPHGHGLHVEVQFKKPPKLRPYLESFYGIQIDAAF